MCKVLNVSLVVLLLATAAWAAVPIGEIVYSVPGGDIYILDTSGGAPVHVPTTVDGYYPHMSNDGQSIIFTSSETFPLNVDADGDGISDASSLLYTVPGVYHRTVVGGGAFGGGCIYTIERDGSNLQTIGNPNDSTRFITANEPSFSPDGLQVSFRGSPAGGVWICNIDGTGLTDMIPGSMPRWAPDGAGLVYGFADLYSYDISSGNSTLITDFAHVDLDFVRASYSPDGQKLAVAVMDETGAAEQSDLWIMNADGTALANLTSDLTDSDQGYPSWSADGEYIVFSSDVSGNWDIWSMRSDGSERTNITNTPGHEWAPRMAVPEPATLDVNVDIKSGSLLNPVNARSKGVLPVTILGTEDFDVSTIDPESILLSLEGLDETVSPIRWALEDVGAPYDGDPSEEDELDPDGFLDLTLKFDTQALMDVLGLSEAQGESLMLELTGNLTEEFGGLAILGSDWIRLLHPGDANADGFINGSDLSTIIRYWGQSVPSGKRGDLNGNGVVDGPDYTEVLSYWGTGTPPEPTATPEPATLALLLIGALALLRRRKSI